MKKEHWFCTPIWFDYLNFDTNKVAEKCIQLRNQGYSNRVLSNVGGWQSVDVSFNEFSEFQIVENILRNKIFEFGAQLNSNYSFRLDNAWININEKGDYNGKHVHPSSSFSGTLFIQVDDKTGNIVFHNDFWMPKHYPVKLEDSDLFHQNVSYSPKNGMIIIFPSWVSHEVLPSESNIARVSISFNLQQNY